MSRARITITAAIPAETYAEGDYAMLFGDGGTGTMDYVTPLSAQRYELWRLGSPVSQITASRDELYPCSLRQYAFVMYDSLGNRQSGDPVIATAHVHVAPDRPGALRATAYDSDTDILSLEVQS